MTDARPIFVLGSMGSGTTVMRLILDSHPDLAIAQETGFLRSALAQRWTPFWKFAPEWLGRIGTTEEEFLADLRDHYATVFGRFAERRGATRWGDKTPFHIWHMEFAARLFPEAQFVATVRHPAAVAVSVHDRFHYSWPRAIAHWSRANSELARQGAALGDRFLLTRYEDLVSDTRGVMERVLGFLGVPWSDNVLRHNEVHAQRGTSTKVEGASRSDTPITTARLAAWVDMIPKPRFRDVQRRSSGLAGVFGYSVDEPVPAGPLGGPGSGPAITGADLARLLAGVDLGPLPSPTFQNSPLTPEALALEVKRAYNAGRKGEDIGEAYRKALRRERRQRSRDGRQGT